MKKEPTLTEKIFTLEYICGLIFYCIGILLITPATEPGYIKLIGGGAMMLALAIFLIQLSLKQNEKMDERARTNMDHASTVTLRIFFILAIIFAIILHLIPMQWSLTAVILFLLGILFLVHAYAFNWFEKAGE